jgi:hypothetical protein
MEAEPQKRSTLSRVVEVETNLSAYWQLNPGTTDQGSAIDRENAGSMDQQHCNLAGTQDHLKGCAGHAVSDLFIGQPSPKKIWLVIAANQQTWRAVLHLTQLETHETLLRLQSARAKRSSACKLETVEALRARALAWPHSLDLPTDSLRPLCYAATRWL